MPLNFEQQKNIKASAYTTLICIVLACLFVVLEWKKAAPIITPPEPTFMEVNLGNSETGAGEIPPLSTEAPATEQGANQEVVAAGVDAEKINTNDASDVNDEAVKTSKDKKNNIATTQKTAANPKAVMGKYKGGNGKGGNNQDSYNNVKDQGIAGGKGDQGVAGGSINGTAYTGAAGPFVTKGDRKVIKAYSFNGDVSPATIYAEIQVSPEGVGTFSQITKGSSSNDNKYKTAIKEYLKKISFDKADHSSVVTVKFKFENSN
jgi:hypothetical protein